jgi:arylformamidase
MDTMDKRGDRARRARRFIDLSHEIYDGLITVPGLPAPVVESHLSREDSALFYASGTSFNIGKIALVANTGTYIDSPFHRYAEGIDLPNIPIERVADIEGVVIRVVGATIRAIDRKLFAGIDVRGKAVLVDTGWGARWQTPAYFDAHPHLTKDAAEYLRDAGAVLVGIDSPNIDDVEDPVRPVHSILLGGGILIVEHLAALGELPLTGFRFTAVPPPVRGLGSFPVRAFATIDVQ